MFEDKQIQFQNERAYQNYYNQKYPLKMVVNFKFQCFTAVKRVENIEL